MSADESDENQDVLYVKPRRRGQETSEGPCAGLNQSNELADITESAYSFSYTENTGSLLDTRLHAMQRSINVANVPRDGAVIENLLRALHNGPDARLAVPLQPDADIGKDDGLPQFLSAPYMDIVKPDSMETAEIAAAPPRSPRLPQRPPSMFRRASSMILKPQAAGLHGIGTPLQHLPSKLVNTQAVFTTEDVFPFRVRTMNDIACLYTGRSQQDGPNTSFLEFIVPSSRAWLVHQISSHSGKHIKLSGEIVELESALRLVSLWSESPGPGLLAWVVREVPAVMLREKALSTIEMSSSMHRVPLVGSDLVLQFGTSFYEPLSIGCVVAIDRIAQNIQAYNHAAVKIMLGYDEQSLVGTNIRELIPQFQKFWPEVEPLCTHVGTVIPEHKFRILSGISTSSPAFLAPYPSRDPTSSIRARDATGKNVYIDMQLRVVQHNLLVLWISYSRPLPRVPALKNVPSQLNLLPKLMNVMNVTPPESPDRSPLSRDPSGRDSTPGHSPASSVTSTETRRLSVDTSFALSPEPTVADIAKIKVGAHRRSQNIDDFEVLAVLGEGAYGKVRLVRTPRRRWVLALKSIYKDRILVDTWSRDRKLGTIPNEIRILNTLRETHHPHIVEMVDFFEDNECYHVETLPLGGVPGSLTQSLKAMDLFDFIETESSNMSQERLLNIWKQIVSAVAHVHDLGIVHRDLKDENVIMDSSGSAKLIDFGSAAYITQGPFDVFVGTIDYAAPEIVQGQAYEGCPQDNWALGILLYTIMYKETPFHGIEEIIVGSLPLTQSCLGFDVMKKLLAKNPSDRPTAREALELLQ